MAFERTVLGLLVWILVMPATAFAADELDPQRLWTERAASAEEIALYAPTYRVDDGREASLFLMNTTAGPLVASVRALSRTGDALELGTYAIESLEHLELDLGALLHAEEEAFARGALEVEFLGDGESLQGWVVQKRGNDVSESPLTASEPTGPVEQVVFWKGAARFTLFNSSDEPGEVAITWYLPGRASEQGEVVTVAPRSQILIEAPAAARAARWRDASRSMLVMGEGEDGSLVLEPSSRLATARRFESLPLLAAGQSAAVVGEIDLMLWNAAREVRRSTIELLAAPGRVFGSISVTTPPGGVRRVTTGQIVEALAAEPSLRLRVSSADPGILASGRIVWRDGTSTPLPLYDADVAHMNGTYPLPDPERHRVETTILNLGTEPSRIVAQVTWSGGTHALGPLEVAPGEVLRLEPGRIAEEAGEDVLGRVLDPRHPAGVLKWTVASGSTTLLGRTSVRPVDPVDGQARADRFGFDCFGCCWQTPRGEIVPGLVELAQGQTGSFQACVTYDTCSGTMGPYPTGVQTKTVPPEISWNGSQLTMNTAVDADIEFTGGEFQTSPGCLVFWRGIFGRARAEGCKFTFNPFGYDPARTCTSQTGGICIACRACCHNLYQQEVCKGKLPQMQNTELQLCLGNCEIDIQDCG